MVAIYLSNKRSDTHKSWGSDTLFRIYDDDEVPNDLQARVQNWANTLDQSFVITDNRDGSSSTVHITAKNDLNPTVK